MTKNFDLNSVNEGDTVYVWSWINGTYSPVTVHKVTPKRITVDSYEAGRTTQVFTPSEATTYGDSGIVWKNKKNLLALKES